MNEQNFEYLKDNIKYMGFGEKIGEALEGQLKQGQPEFSLANKIEVNKKPFEVSLNFRKSDNSDMYFFNSYKASLIRSNGEKLDQTFYLNKGKGITAKEAYNLLEGRSVFKELTTKDGESYKTWVQLNLDKKDSRNNFEIKQFHENYGFNLKSAMSKFGISDLQDPENEKALIHSLQKGNIQSVSVEKNGESLKLFIEANPQYKTINIYNDQFQRLGQEQRLELIQNVGAKQGNAEKLDNGEKQEVKTSKSKSKGREVQENGDTPKKTKSRKKGISP